MRCQLRGLRRSHICVELLDASCTFRSPGCWIQDPSPARGRGVWVRAPFAVSQNYSSGTSNSATILMILICACGTPIPFPSPVNGGRAKVPCAVGFDYSSGTSRSATMLMILISGLIAGPAVSLYGSPTVSPVTAALCASLPLPPK